MRVRPGPIAFHMPAWPNPAPHVSLQAPSLCQWRAAGRLRPRLGQSWKSGIWVVATHILLLQNTHRQPMPQSCLIFFQTGTCMRTAFWWCRGQGWGPMGSPAPGTAAHTTSCHQPCLGFSIYKLVCSYRPQRGALGLN